MTAHQDDHREPYSTVEEEDPVRTREELLRGRVVSFCKAFVNGQSPQEILDEHFVVPDGDGPRITEHGPVWAGEHLPFLGRTFVGRRHRRHPGGLAGPDDNDDDDDDDDDDDEHRQGGDDEDQIKCHYGYYEEEGEEKTNLYHQSCDDYFDLLGQTLRPVPGTLAFPERDQFIVDALADVYDLRAQTHFQQQRRQYQRQQQEHGDGDEKPPSISASLSSPSKPPRRRRRRRRRREGVRGEGGAGGGAGGERESEDRENQGGKGTERGRRGGLVSVSGTGQWQSVQTGQGRKESFTFRLSQFDHQGFIGHWEIWADPLSAWLAVHGDLSSSSQCHLSIHHS